MRYTALPLTLLVTACQTASLASGQDALLVAPDTNSRSIVQQAASQLLGGVPVLLADDAFMHESRITMERSVRHDPNGFRIEDRGLMPSPALRLVLTAQGCALRLETTGKQIALKDVPCTSAPSKAAGGHSESQ